MPKLTETQIRAEIDSTFPDNVTGNITAANVRSFMNKLVDNLLPDSAGCVITTDKVFSLTTSYQVINTFDQTVVLKSSLSATTGGVITVNDAGLVSLSGRFGITIPSNKQVTLEVFVDGVGTGLPITQTGDGTTDNIQFTFPYGARLQPAGATIDIRMKAGSATDVTIKGGFIQATRLNLGND